jgi:gas vesicle protein
MSIHKYKKGILFSLGAFLGMMTGLTLAKRTGKELRNDIHQAFNKKGLEHKWQVLEKELTSVGKEFVDAINEINSRSDVQSLVQKGKTKLDELKNDLQKQLTNWEKEGQKYLNGLKKEGLTKIKEFKKLEKKEVQKINVIKDKSLKKAKDTFNSIKRKIE